MSDVRSDGHAIETMQVEERRFAPSPDFSRQANAQPDIYERGFDAEPHPFTPPAVRAVIRCLRANTKTSATGSV